MERDGKKAGNTASDARDAVLDDYLEYLDFKINLARRISERRAASGAPKDENILYSDEEFDMKEMLSIVKDVFK